MKVSNNAAAVANANGALSTPVAHRRIALYGDPKSGKTRLATDLPWDDGTDPSGWGEQAIYVAWDADSGARQSVLQRSRERLIVVQPTYSGGKKDPGTEASNIAFHNWKKDFPKVNTIIWDTMTTTSREILSAVAASGVFSDKHVTHGAPGTPAHVANPMEGDYGMTQMLTQHIIGHLFAQPLNVVVIFHGDWVEPKSGEPGGLTGGPQTVGKAAIRTIGSMFQNLFRVEAKAIVAPGQKAVTKHMVYTTKRGIWMAGIQTPYAENPIPELEIGTEPRKVWEMVDRATQGGI